MGIKIEVKIQDVRFDVDYDMSGNKDDADLEQVLIYIGDQEVSNVLDDKVLREIDSKIYEHFWKNTQEGPEPDDREDR